MDRAINKSTENIVSAFEIYKNGSYQNLTKSELPFLLKNFNINSIVKFKEKSSSGNKGVIK